MKTDIGSPPKTSFWYDERNRSVIFQALALVLALLLIGFFGRNVANNLSDLGLNINFSFLSQPSNYDINQTLIEYSSRSTHARAMTVGILNTLLIAVAGILLSTLIGFVFGVLRVSNNWLFRNLVYAYVEIVRNVPVLLQILLWHGILIHSLPHPKKALEVGDMFFTNRGLYAPKPNFEPLFWIVAIACIAGIIGSIWLYKKSRKIQVETGVYKSVLLKALGLIIVIPLVLFFILGTPVVMEAPVLTGFNFKGGMVLRPEFVALWIALSVYTSAFICENVRAGVLSVSKGQTEAAYALGLRPSLTVRLIILPQALKVIIPPLISQYLNLTKNSSLAIAIGYFDIVATIGGITLNQTGRAMECMIIVLALYLSISFAISILMNVYNKRTALRER